MPRFRAPCLALLGCTACAGELPDPAEHDLESYFEAWAEDGFAGTVLVTQGDEVLYTGAAGTCAKPDIACARDTVYDIGSLTKQFTAAGILALMDQGALTPEDTLERWFEVPDDKSAITLHHLMTHTSGIRDPNLLADYASVSRADVLDNVLSRELASAPGDEHAYSNHNYSLLGAVLELETGKTFDQAMADLIFTPAGLTDSGYLLPDWATARLAEGHGGFLSPWKNPLEFNWDDDGPWWNLRANGGLLSTVDDLFAWHRALRDGTVLPAETVELAQTPYVREFENGSTFYGYGWVVGETEQNRPEVWHDGGNGKFYALAIRYPEPDIAVFFATNHERNDDFRLAWGLASIALRDAVDP